MKVVLIIAINLLNLINVLTQDVDQQPASVNSWYETLPAVAMDYKVYVDAGETVFSTYFD